MLFPVSSPLRLHETVSGHCFLARVSQVITLQASSARTSEKEQRVSFASCSKKGLAPSSAEVTEMEMVLWRKHTERSTSTEKEQFLLNHDNSLS